MSLRRESYMSVMRVIHERKCVTWVHMCNMSHIIVSCVIQALCQESYHTYEHTLETVAHSCVGVSFFFLVGRKFLCCMKQE